MTEREREIYQLIEANPLISQAEIAELLSITRASVGVHISNLVKKGYIMGKGYIMAYDRPATVIGGSNVDIQGAPTSGFVMEDSNPGEIRTFLGGVGRNIAENMRCLGLDTRLITAVGEDKEGQMIRESAMQMGIDMEETLVTAKESTSSYMYILNDERELVAAISDMSVVDMLTPGFFNRLLAKIDYSPYTVIDGNLPQASIEYLAMNLKETKLVLDPVSVAKAVRALDVLGSFYAVKVNKLEAEALLGTELKSKGAIEAAGKALLDKGVNRVFITLGGDGVYYCDAEGGFFRQAMKVDVVNVTGAGDAFTAAMVYAFVNDLNRDETVDFCVGASVLALSSHDTISSDMSPTAIKQLYKQ